MNNLLLQVDSRYDIDFWPDKNTTILAIEVVYKIKDWIYQECEKID
jgi:hypothetical protein